MDFSYCTAPILQGSVTRFAYSILSIRIVDISLLRRQAWVSLHYIALIWNYFPLLYYFSSVLWSLLLPSSNLRYYTLFLRAFYYLPTYLYIFISFVIALSIPKRYLLFYSSSLLCSLQSYVYISKTTYKTCKSIIDLC